MLMSHARAVCLSICDIALDILLSGVAVLTRCGDAFRVVCDLFEDGLGCLGRNGDADRGCRSVGTCERYGERLRLTLHLVDVRR